MKILSSIALILFISFFSIYTYAYDEQQTELSMVSQDDDAYDTETDETSEYNIDIKPYVNVKYTSSRSTYGKK